VSWEDGRNDRDSVPSLSKGQQCVWRATFKGNVRPEVRHATGRIKCDADGETGVQKQKRMRPQSAYIYAVGFLEIQSGTERRNKLERRQRWARTKSA